MEQGAEGSKPAQLQRWEVEQLQLSWDGGDLKALSRLRQLYSTDRLQCPLRQLLTSQQGSVVGALHDLAPHCGASRLAALNADDSPQLSCAAQLAALRLVAGELVHHIVDRGAGRLQDEAKEMRNS